MKKLGRLTFLITGLLLMMLWPGILWPADKTGHASPGLTASIDPGPVTLGDTVRLTLTYKLPDGTHLPEKLRIKGIEGLTILDQRVAAGTIVIKALVDQLDTWQTKDLSLTYLDRSGAPQTLSAPPVSVPVRSNLREKPDEAQLRPIQGILPTRARWMTYFPWLAGFLGLALVCLGAWWWRKKRHIDEIYADILDPPHLRAKKELERLNGEKLFETGHVKGFYFRFSEIMRQYLGAIRGFSAVELTTEEIAMLVKNDEDRTLLDLLRQADLVKFADALPTAARKDEQITAAFRFIEKNTPPTENGSLHAVDERPER